MERLTLFFHKTVSSFHQLRAAKIKSPPPHTLFNKARYHINRSWKYADGYQSVSISDVKQGFLLQLWVGGGGGVLLQGLLKPPLRSLIYCVQTCVFPFSACIQENSDPLLPNIHRSCHSRPGPRQARLCPRSLAEN